MRTALTRALRVLAECLGSSTTRRNAAAATKAVPPSAHRFSGVNNAVNAVIESLEQRALMSTYYVSTSGSDSNNGTSTSSPWKSIAKVSSTHLNPGDSVLFQGGKTFSGSLSLYNDGGSSTDRVTISSYGSGDATISSGTANGAWSLNSTGITFDNLIFVGTLGNTFSQDGIRIENYSANTVRSGFTVENCTISGYAHGGVDFGSDASSEGLNDLTINNNNIYNNEEVGIESWSITTQSNTNITISNNLVHNNYGDGHSTVTGSGIMLQGLNGAMVEYNSAYDNGLKGGNGGVGIWCYSSNDVTFQYNTSVGNFGSSIDGDGFDFDADTSNSVMQYNYAADNTGGGFMLSQWMNDSDFTNDIIRYNISQNNGRAHNYSGINIWGKVLNAQIYNNTVYDSPASNGGSSAFVISNTTISGMYASNIHVANNIFVTTGGVPFVDFYAAAMTGASNIKFTGNVYYSYGGTSSFVWGSTTYSSFASWQSATGQEKVNGADVGMYANPALTAPGQASSTALATQLSSVTADYTLLSNTPILNAGVGLDSILSLAVPLTGNSTGKTVPGYDQHLASAISGSTTSATASTSTAPAKGTIVGLDYFIASDIGNPNKGSNSISGTTNTVTGGGTGVGGTSDSMRFAYTSLSGNGQIVAEVSSLSDAQSTAEAGLMIRSSTAANAQSVALMVNNNKSATLVNRATTGASSTSTTVNDSGDAWIKMVRNGNVFSSYISANGTTWTLVGSTTVTMSSTVLIGVAVSSESLSYTETAVFKNVAFSGTIS
jgi:regulation of enolase protein 1 (concanavalin A-like superfamily)